MPPEQALARSRDIDGQTDVWATGATLFALLTGALAHSGETGAELMVNGATVPARSVASAVKDVPAAVAHLVDRALAFDKASRWPSAAAMRDAARDAFAELFGEAISNAPVARLFEPASGAVRVRLATDPRGAGDAFGASQPTATAVPTLAGFPQALPESAGPPQVPPPAGPGVGDARPERPTDSPITTSSGRDRAPRAKNRWTGSVLIGVAAVALVAVAMFVFRGASPTVAAEASPPAGLVTTQKPMDVPPPPVDSSPAPPWVEAPSTASAAPTVVPRAPTPAAPVMAPVARPAASSKQAPAAPCKLVTTLDKSGETHFSCPCAKCE
jgi:serine/threonine-protein kinase